MKTEESKGHLAAAETKSVQVPGPWEACERSGYDTAYWTVRRRNPAWMVGWEYATNKSGNPLRFGSKAGAERAAQAKNTGETP